MGEGERALAEYEAALVVAPEFAAAHYNLARLHARLQRIDECLLHLQKAMELVPDLRADAAEDDDLGWVLRLDRFRQERRRGPRDLEV